jgi:hypothetical protein
LSRIRAYVSPVVIGLWVLSSPPTVTGQTVGELLRTKDSLATLESVRPLVLVNTSTSEVLKTAGISEGDIKTRIEVTLRRSGLLVPSGPLPEGTPRALVLLEISAIQTTMDALYLLNFSLHVVQGAVIARERPLEGLYATWWKTTASAAGITRLAESINGSVDSLTLSLANDWLAVNPR